MDVINSSYLSVELEGHGGVLPDGDVLGEVGPGGLVGVDVVVELGDGEGLEVALVLVVDLGLELLHVTVHVLLRAQHLGAV